MGFITNPNPFLSGVCLFNFKVKILSHTSYESPQSINVSLSSSLSVSEEYL